MLQCSGGEQVNACEKKFTKNIAKNDSKFSSEGKNDTKKFEPKTLHFGQPTQTNHTLVACQRSVSIGASISHLSNVVERRDRVVKRGREKKDARLKKTLHIVSIYMTYTLREPP